MAACPNCGAPDTELLRIDAGLKLHLQSQPQFVKEVVPDAVCASCHNQFSSSLSQGAILRQQHAAKEQNRLMLWRTRVNLVKQAKAQLMAKMFSEAAVSYEKYLRVLEIVYDKKAGELAPELFKNAGRQQEITVIASVYWDLMRIYDASPKYGDRQSKAAEKLAEFARFTPIFPSVIRKAEIQLKIAKNPQHFKRFLSLSNRQRPRCFIATSAFNYEANFSTLTLCEFRDKTLKKNRAGRAFIYTYYRYSPGIADWLDKNPSLKPPVRAMVRVAATCVRAISA